MNLDSPDCPELLDIETLADALGLSRRLIDREIRSRTFPYKWIYVGKRRYWPRESLREQLRGGNVHRTRVA